MKQNINVNVNRSGGGHKYTVCESLRYAVKVGAIGEALYDSLSKDVLQAHKNDNQRASREIYEIAKSCKAGLYSYYDAWDLLWNIVHELCN